MKKIYFLFAVFIGIQASAQDSQNINLLYNWTTDGMPASSAWGNVYNEVWGYAADDREYAIIGTTGGTHFIDVTNPTESEEVDFVAGYQTGPVVVHRDYHTMGDYLFMVCQEGVSKLRVADLSYLPDSVHIIYDSYEFIKGSHNIFIDTVQARLYAVTVYQAGVSGLTGMRVLDISDPYQPALLGDMFENEDVHDLYVNDGLAYLNRGYSNGMEIWDFTELPGTMLGSITEYEGQGYNHSGYPTPDGNYFVMGDETHGSPLKMLDVSDPTDIEVLATMSSDVHSLSIAHNQIIHNNMVFSAFYYDGLYVWDIENPEDPDLVGFYDTSTVPHDDSFEGAWGVYPFLPSGNILVSDMQSGLWVLEFDASLSAENTAEIAVNIWPNPVTDKLSIRVNSNATNYQLVDILGNELQNGVLTEGNNSLDMSALPEGMYLLQVETAQGLVSTKKVIKN